MIPTVGRIVHYTLSEHDVLAINRRRADSRAAGPRTDGAVVHTGNAVSEGDVYPLIITRIWSSPPAEGTACNGQVLLDGNDTLWVTSVTQGEGPCHWVEPPRA